MSRQEVSARESQSTGSSAAAWFGTVVWVVVAGLALLSVIVGYGATSEAGRPPVSAYVDSGAGPTMLAGLIVAVLVTWAVWLTVRTATGRSLSKTATVVVLAASFLLIQAAMAGVSELGRRNAEAAVRTQAEVWAIARAEACSGADMDLLGDVYSTLGSRWGPFTASGRTDGSCHGPKIVSNDRADRDSDWVVALMTDDGWTLAESRRFLAFERGTDRIQMGMDYFRDTPNEGSDLVVVGSSQRGAEPWRHRSEATRAASPVSPHVRTESDSRLPGWRVAPSEQMRAGAHANPASLVRDLHIRLMVRGPRVRQPAMRAVSIAIAGECSENLPCSMS